MRILTHLATATIGALIGIAFSLPESNADRSESSRSSSTRVTGQHRVPEPIGVGSGVTPIDKATRAKLVEPPEGVAVDSHDVVVAGPNEEFEGPWTPPPPQPTEAPTRPPTVPEIRAAKMTAILVEASLYRPGTESERLLQRLEKLRAEVLAALEPVHRKLLADLESCQRSFKHTPAERTRRLRLARQRVIDTMSAVAPRETVMRALEVSPALANATDE